MKFKYQATDARARRTHGEIEAVNDKAARAQLRAQGLIPESLKAVSGQGLIPRRVTLSGNDLVLLTRQMATLVGASLPLEQCLHALARQADKPHIRQLLITLRQKIQEGETFAGALACFPGTFSPVYRATVAAGEASGQLGRVMEQLADYTERVRVIKNKVIQGLIYPLMLTVVAVIVVCVLLTAVVPRVTEQFVQMKQALPLATRLLLTLSDGLLAAYPWILLLLLIAVPGMRIALRKPSRRYSWHRWLLTLPLAGSTLKNLDLARYARTLSILAGSAVPLLEGMRISASVLSNDYISQKLSEAGDRVREGVSLTRALADTQLLSPMMHHMIASGESSGELDQMLARAAELQENTFSGQMVVAMALFEPLIVIVMAGVVLFIILAILQPILQLNNLIG